MIFGIDGRPGLQPAAKRAAALPLAFAFLAAFGCQNAPEGPAPLPAMPPPSPPRPDAAPPPPPPPTPDSGAVTTVDSGLPPDSGAPAPATDGGSSGDTAPAVSLFVDPLAPAPMDLKDVGLFTALPDRNQVNARAFKFEPRYPLWSNGLDKVRYAVIPEGQKIDTTMRDAWAFPVGTMFFKTFSFKDPAAGGQDKPVETRLIRRVKADGPLTDQWEFVVYEWNAEGTAATQLDIRRKTPRQVTIDGETFTHNIPKRGDCWNCHIANKSPIIGFDELRLNFKVGTAAQTQLEQVVAKQWLTRAPTAPLAAVTGGRTPLETQVMEYLQANCAHCHNGLPGLEPGARYPMLDLRPAQLLRNTVNVMTMSVGTAAGTRIVPGDPARSILLLAMKAIADPAANMEVKPMPTVGVERMDKNAVDLVQMWIQSLPR